MATAAVKPRSRQQPISWARIILAVVVLYAILLFGPIAGLDIPRIARDIAANPSLLVQQLIVGITNGAIIAIVALGYTLVYGIIELINFANADVFMLGGFMALSIIGNMGVTANSSAGLKIAGLVLAFVGAGLLGAVLNWTIERFAYKPLRNAPRLAPLISAIGVSFMLQNIGLIWGGLRPFFPIMGLNAASPKSMPEVLPRIPLLPASSGIEFGTKDLIVVVTALVLWVALRLFIQYTTLGKAMRATAQNRDASKIVGIHVDRVIAVTFLIGGALAGAAGCLVGFYNNTIVFTMGFTFGLRSFTAAVLGGIGNVTGAALGGILIGVVAAFSDQYLSSRWTNAWIFAILIIILIFRPLGLLGEAAGEKA